MNAVNGGVVMAFAQGGLVGVGQQAKE